MLRRLIVVMLVALVGCKKPPEQAPPPAASSVAVAATTPTTDAGTGSKHRRGQEDRHEAAEDSGVPIRLDVKIAGAEAGTAPKTSTWKKDSFDKVSKYTTGNVGNDGEQRETWSLRELAHTLVGPNARVVRVVGEETKAIDRAAWNDSTRTPILHTTRRGTFKFRWADAKGKWSDADVREVTLLEIAIEP